MKWLAGLVVLLQTTKRIRTDWCFQDEYKAICSKSEEFAVDYLSLCRTAGEVQVLLNKTTGVEKTTTKGSKAIFPRLLVALHYGQKQVDLCKVCLKFPFRGHQ